MRACPAQKRMKFLLLNRYYLVCCLLTLAALLLPPNARTAELALPTPEDAPRIYPASDEGELALKQFHPHVVSGALAHLNVDMAGATDPPLSLNPGLLASAGLSGPLMRAILERARRTQRAERP